MNKMDVLLNNCFKFSELATQYEDIIGVHVARIEREAGHRSVMPKLERKPVGNKNKAIGRGVPREERIKSMYCEGKSEREIAYALKIARSEVVSYLEKIKADLLRKEE